MIFDKTVVAALLFSLLAANGCRSNSSKFIAYTPPTVVTDPAEKQASVVKGSSSINEKPNDGLQQAFHQEAGRASQEEVVPTAAEPETDKLALPASIESLPEAETLPEEAISIGSVSESKLSVNISSVVLSVRNFFPVVKQAEANRIIASGERLSASGAFDHKLDGYSNVQPLDFYENNWHKWSVKRDTMWGGQVGAGYRLGRGSFEPWYKERETNDLGELGVFAIAPIGRDRAIDANRSELWQAQLEQNRVEPFIQSQLIMAVREGAIAYWKWIAASEIRRIQEDLLKIGLDRAGFLSTQVRLGEKAPIDITDNNRIILSRRSKLIDAKRKQQQAAIKLSLYLRDAFGEPLLLDSESASESFGPVNEPGDIEDASDVNLALSNRPELLELAIQRQQVSVAYRQAANETRVDVDAGIFVGQDIGAATKDRDKSEAEIEATLMVSVPLERRKAMGKVRQARGKLAQLRAKTEFARNKITAEVQSAKAALEAAAIRVEQNSEALALTEEVQQAERRRYEEGETSLFNLNLREKQLAEAAAELVYSKLEYFVALSDYGASLGLANDELFILSAEQTTPERDESEPDQQ